MAQSLSYNFLLNMWVMRRCTEAHLDLMVTKGTITQAEKEMIVATPQQ